MPRRVNLPGADELFRVTGLPAIDCVVRLAKPVNSKDGPATTAALKRALRVELARLFAAQAKLSGRQALAQAVQPAQPIQPPAALPSAATPPLTPS